VTDALQRLSTVLSGRYRLERELGSGGMATVFLAEDLRHHRHVAVKVLRPELSAMVGAERFLKEIEVTANLQHPHLLPLFDSGEAAGMLFYVMPHVPGESLRTRLKRERQLGIDEAIRITTQVASALDYAHRHSVIHRDIKPENILLHEGEALIADFGIALALRQAGGNRLTETGLSLGTPQYMSPEQATGDRELDARSDIYSLACVLYEMLAGEPPHTGPTVQSVIAKLLTDRPRPITDMRHTVPVHVAAALDVALAKVPADRFATAHEFAECLSGRVTTARPASRSRKGWEQHVVLRLRELALIVVALGVGAVAAWHLRSDGVDRDLTVRFQLALPPEQGAIRTGIGSPYAFSADGRLYAYRAGPTGEPARLYIRRVDEAAGRAVPGTENALVPTFSPDGQWLAFHVGGLIKKIHVDGSTPARLTEIPDNAAGMSWARGALVVGSSLGGLRIVPEDGGPARYLTTPDTASGEIAHRFPAVLPDGETVLFTVYPRRGGARGSRIGLLSLRTGERTSLNLSGAAALGALGDVLVYHDGEGTLHGISFDIRRRRVTGRPVPLVDGVSFGARSAVVWAGFSASGALIYDAGGATNPRRELVAVGTDGQSRPVTGLQQAFAFPRYSPDGSRIAVMVRREAAGEVWIYDIGSQTFTPLIPGIDSRQNEWSPDGRYVLFTANPSGRIELWRRLADGSAPAERLQGAGRSGEVMHGIMSPDQRFLIYRTGNAVAGQAWDDLWYRSLDGDTTSKALAADPRFVERHPAVSPDGRWVAYCSNESGLEQVYVQPFPGPAPRQAVSLDGGTTPVWSRDGRKLYWRSANRMVEAVIATGPRFSVARRVLFEGDFVDETGRNYDLSPDGRHFLTVRAVNAGGRSATVVIHNWETEVRRRMGSARSANR
jgi:Tol biopolymer transport system component